MDLAQLFLAPQNASHRQYEALRAYFVEQLPGPEVARRFGYTRGSLHQLIHQFAVNPTGVSSSKRHPLHRHGLFSRRQS